MKKLGFSGTESPVRSAKQKAVQGESVEILLLHSLKNRSCLLFDVFRGVCQSCWKTSPGPFWLNHEWENSSISKWRPKNGNLRLDCCDISSPMALEGATATPHLWWNMILWTFLYKIRKLSEAKEMKKSARKLCSRRKKNSQIQPWSLTWELEKSGPAKGESPL